MNQGNPADAAAALAGTIILLPMFMCFMVVVVQGFWIWMIVDCATNPGLVGSEKTVWIIVVVFTNWLGALIYFFVGRPKRFPKSRKPPSPQQILNEMSPATRLTPIDLAPPPMKVSLPDPPVTCSNCDHSSPYSAFSVDPQNRGSCPHCHVKVAFE